MKNQEKTKEQLVDEIEQLKRGIEKLKRSEEKYRLLFENASDAVMIFDAESLMFEDANKATLDLYGYTKEEFLALSVGDISAEKSATRIVVGKIISGEPDSQYVPLRYFRRKDGSVFPGEICAGTFISGGHKRIIGAVRNISERARIEDQIRLLSQLLMQAQERERQMISYELHDGIAQNLSSLKIGCDTLFEDQPAISGELKNKMGNYSALIEQTISAVRDLAYDLRPPALDEIDMAKALETYCEEFSENSDLEDDFQSVGMHGSSLNHDAKIHLYRLVQEGLNNVRKHADATRVFVKLIGTTPNIILRIEDNGKGFDVKARELTLDNEKRMGLRSMRERVNLLQGQMSIRSRLTKGTRIFIKFPFEEQDGESKEAYRNR